MNKILIATDFSLPAENAARYALALAKKMKADIVLCHAFKVPSEAPTSSHVIWPLMEFADLKQEVKSELDSLVKLLYDPLCKTDQDGYCPDLVYESGVGSVSDVVANLVLKEKIDLVIMGMTGASGLTQFLLGGNSKEMIEKTNVPLLLVPFEAGFNNIRKIAFATDLHTEDTVPLQFLINLAIPLNAKITIAHVTKKEVDPQGKVQQKIDAFLNKVAADVTFSRMKYEYVWNIAIDDGLNWIAAQDDLDMMAITHCRHNFLARIISGSHTQKLSRHIKIPLLVFPHSTKVT